MSFISFIKKRINKNKSSFSDIKTKQTKLTEDDNVDTNLAIADTNANKNPPTRLISGSQSKHDKSERQSMIDFIDMQNPDKILKKFGAEVYDNMESSDSHLFAVYQTRKLAISLCPWELNPANDEAGSIMIRDFVLNVINESRGPFSENIRQLADAIGKGFSILEIVWKLIDKGQWKGKFGIDEFIFHKQKFWRFTEKNARKYRTPIVYFVDDDSRVEGTNIPWEKLILYTYNSQGSMYGESSFKSCYWQTWFKKEGWKSWMVFLDKYSFPVTVGTFQEGASKGEQDLLLEILESIQKETCLVIPETMKVKFLEASRSGPVSFIELIQACNSEISKCLLGATQTVEEGSRGSYALSRAHSDVRKERVEADIVSISDVIQQQLINRIVDFNFKTDIYPKFVMKYPWSPQKVSEKDTSKGGRPELFAEKLDPFAIGIENGLLKTYGMILNTYKNTSQHHPVNVGCLKKALLEKYDEDTSYKISSKIKDIFEKEIMNNNILGSFDKAYEAIFNII